MALSSQSAMMQTGKKFITVSQLEVNALPHYSPEGILDWSDKELRIKLVEELLKFQPIMDREAWMDRYGYGYYVLEQGDMELLMGLDRQMILPNPVRDLRDCAYLERFVVTECCGIKGQFMYSSIVGKLAMLEWKKAPFKYDPTFLSISFIPELKARALALFSFGEEAVVVETLEGMI